MKNSAVPVSVGATPASLTEQMLSTVQASLVVSRRIAISRNLWRIDVESPFWRLYFHTREGVVLTTAGKTLKLRPRTIYLIPAWLRFQATTTCDLVQDFLHFNLTGIPLTLARSIFHQPTEISLREPGVAPVVRQWRQGIGEHGNVGLEEQFWTNALIQVAMGTALRSLPDAYRTRLDSWLRTSHPIGAALQLIERNLAHPPSNAELAGAVGQSTDHFARRFKAAVGMTLARYGVERRIALAAERLLMTDEGIEHIAVQSGFADRFHFSRAFRTVIGMPPGRFRSAHQ